MKVLAKAEELGVTFNLRDISSDPQAASELLEKGGKQQVPFLVDADNNVSMYESDDIIAYITQRHGAEA